MLYRTMTYYKKKSKELIFKENLPEFIKKINPVQLLPYLPCLPRQAMEKIQAHQTNNGPSDTVFLLYQHLIMRSDKWFEEFTQALRSEDINQPELANLLDPEHNDLKEQDFKCGEITAHTPFRKLNQSVLQALLVLDHEGSLQNWRDLASILGYSIELVNKIEAYRSGSYTKILLEHWMKLKEANLGTLLQALEILEREDLICEIEKITKFKYPRDTRSKDDVQSQSEDVILFDRSNHRTEVADSCNQISRDTGRCNEEIIRNNVDDPNMVNCGDTGRFTLCTSSSVTSTDICNHQTSHGGLYFGNNDSSCVRNRSTSNEGACYGDGKTCVNNQCAESFTSNGGTCYENNDIVSDQGDASNFRFIQETSTGVACSGHSDCINGENQSSEGTGNQSETNIAKQDSVVFSGNNKQSTNFALKTEIYEKSEHEMEKMEGTIETPFYYNGNITHHSNKNILENDTLELHDLKQDLSKTMNVLECNDSNTKETFNQCEVGEETVECENKTIADPVQNTRETLLQDTNVSFSEGEIIVSIQNPPTLNDKSICNSFENNGDYPINEIDQQSIISEILNFAQRETTLSNQETLISNFYSDDSNENNEDAEFDSLTDENLNYCDKNKKYFKDKIINTNSLGIVGTCVVGVAGIATLAIFLAKKL